MIKIRPKGRRTIHPWWFRLDLNQRHKALQASALPTELQNHTSIIPQLTPNSKVQTTTPKKIKPQTGLI